MDVRFLPPAHNYIKKLKDKRLKELIQASVDKIIKDPYVGDPKTGDLKGIYSFDLYYQRCNYEISYKIIETEEPYILFIMVGTRENYYNELKKYLK